MADTDGAWQRDERGGANLVRVVARNLCQKLCENAERPSWIFNHRGVGYRMLEPDER